MHRVTQLNSPAKWFSLGPWRWDIAAVLFLLALSLFHLPMQLVCNFPWEDPRSFRKPILFGVSTGLTLGSLLLLMSELRPRRWDGFVRGLLCTTLVSEVLLITFQAWRHVPSHFNRSTNLDACIESLMLIFILIALVLIVLLTIRSFQREAFSDSPPARILAQQIGMLFLVLSCILGIGITVLGNYLQYHGGSPEKFGGQGVLKFPHGAVLHAIQTLVLWSWLCDVFGSSRGSQAVAWLAGSHGLFLIYAVRQTLLGQGRWESDGIGSALLGGVVASAFISLLFSIWPRRS